MVGKVKKAVAPKKKVNGYKMPIPVPIGEVISDSTLKKKWRIGPSIGVGGFGEIYSACDHNKKGSTYPYVVKIEPIENGPLFIEKHFYLRNGNENDIANFMKEKKLSSLGMPSYHGGGTHDINGEKLRYLVLERYGKDIWSLFTECGRHFPSTTVFLLGLQMLNVLEYIHSRGYVHADIKGANILLGLKKGTENQAYLVDFGLATRVSSDKEFKPDPKCAHNGTIEYTSRDAHLGVSTMRGDLEILGYNLLQWLVGELPWEKYLKQPKTVQTMKENFMKNVRNSMSKYTDVPDALTEFFEYIASLKPSDTPNYAKCRKIFESYLKNKGKTRTSNLEFVKLPNKKKRSSKLCSELSTDGVEITIENIKPKRKKVMKKTEQNNSDNEEEVTDEPPKQKKSKKSKVIEAPSINEDYENEELKNEPTKQKKNIKKSKGVTENQSNNEDCENEKPDRRKKARNKSVKNIRFNKRKSIEPVIATRAKRIKSVPTSTPPAKEYYTNIRTQTSVEKLKQNTRTVSFDSPISEIIGEKSANSSGDIFDDSFTIKGNKIKKRLISKESITVKKVFKKKETITKKSKSWKDMPTIVNGKFPPT